MLSRRELLQTETYWTVKIQNQVFNAVQDYLDKNDLNQSQFARKLGVSRGYVSQILNGDFDHRISKLVKLAMAVGKVPMISLENLPEVVWKETEGMVRQPACYVEVASSKTVRTEISGGGNHFTDTEFPDSPSSQHSNTYHGKGVIMGSLNSF